MLATHETASTPFPIVCLGCGCPRIVHRTATRSLDAPLCPACGYVGWRETTVAELLDVREEDLSLERPPLRLTPPHAAA